jgi:hypothetical protein
MSEQIDTHLEKAIEEARGFIAERPLPDLTAHVMRRIEELGVAPAQPPIWSRLTEFIWRPRRAEFRWRPAYVLVGAAAVLLLTVFVPYTSQTSDSRLFVQFRLDAPDAMDVRLAGSFTNWQPRYELHEASPGIWTITLPLSAGVHDYVFVVDGQRWVADPYAQKVDDGFGGVNSRIALVPPDAPRL